MQQGILKFCYLYALEDGLCSQLVVFADPLFGFVFALCLQLRNLAFKKLPQKSSAPPSTLTLQGLASELLNSADRTSAPQESWQEWKQRDERVKTSDEL